jgi:hypothetical protein
MSRRVIALFFVLVLSPFLFSTMVMIREVGVETLGQALAGDYMCPPGYPCNPIPNVMLGLSASSVFLALFAILAIFLARRISLARIPTILKLTAQVFIVIATGLIYRYTTGFLVPLIWLPKFGDYLLGLPASPTAVVTSWYVVFPLSILAFLLGIPWLRRPSVIKHRHHDTNEAA